MGYSRIEKPHRFVCVCLFSPLEHASSMVKYLKVGLILKWTAPLRMNVILVTDHRKLQPFEKCSFQFFTWSQLRVRSVRWTIIKLFMKCEQIQIITEINFTNLHNTSIMKEMANIWTFIMIKKSLLTFPLESNTYTAEVILVTCIFLYQIVWTYTRQQMYINVNFTTCWYVGYFGSVTSLYFKSWEIHQVKL